MSEREGNIYVTYREFDRLAERVEAVSARTHELRGSIGTVDRNAADRDTDLRHALAALTKTHDSERRFVLGLPARIAFAVSTVLNVLLATHALGWY